MPEPINRRTQQKQATREQIFLAAKRLFVKKGFEKSTLREVAREAGVAPGTIFTHFQDKVDLLTAVLEEEVEALVAESCQSFPSDAPLIDQLMHIPQGLFPHYAKHRKLFHPLMKEAFFLDPKQGEKLFRQFEAHRQSMEQLFERAKEKGEIAADADTALASYCFFSHYVFLLIGLMSNPEQKVDETLNKLASMLEVMLDGFRPKEPSS